MESLNDLITNVVFDISHIVFACFANNNMEGEAIDATKHVTKKTSCFIKVIERNNVKHGNHITTTQSPGFFIMWKITNL